ncbi:MAG: armadillo-type protein [Piptocephalis tieghemiana]|nr:MAG: armadillo-type protein [Piptocephalis tieghemiana]
MSYRHHPSARSQHPTAGPRRHNGRGPGQRNGYRRSGGQGPQDLESRFTALLMKVGDQINSADTSYFADQIHTLVDVLLADLDDSALAPHIRRVFARCIVEFPTKTPMYATLAGLLNARNPKVGEALLKDECLSLLRSSLTAGDWRATKLLLRFYAQSILTNSLTLPSFHALIQPLLQELSSISPSTSLLRDRGDALALTLLQALPYGGRPLLSTDEPIFTIISHWMIRRVESLDHSKPRTLDLLSPYPPTQDATSHSQPPYPVVESLQGWYEAVRSIVQKEVGKDDEAAMADTEEDKSKTSPPSSSSSSSLSQASVSVLLQPHIYFDSTLAGATPVDWVGEEGTAHLLTLPDHPITPLSSLYPLPTAQFILFPPEDQELKEEKERAAMDEEGSHTLPKAISTTLPPPDSVEWWVLHDIIGDTIDLYECNRREGLRLILAIQEQCIPGTFRSVIVPPGRDPLDEDEREEEGRKAWRLEALILQVIFSKLFSLPHLPGRHIIAYSSLTSDVMRPHTRFPLVYGKGIRTLFSRLGSMDLECSRRLTDAFSHHLSNHTFYWNWSNWAEQIRSIEPKEEGGEEEEEEGKGKGTPADVRSRDAQRIFIRETLLRMTWLSYHDRIKSTVPEEWVGQGPESLIPNEVGPRPILTASSDDSSESTATRGLIQSLREGLRLRKDFSVVEKQVKAFIHPESSDMEDGMAQEEIRRRRLQARDALFECILEHGIKSTSHMLGALERYLPLLRDLGVREGADTGKGLVNLIVRYWGGHGGFFRIVIDKMVTYRVIETKEVMDWVLGQEGLGSQTTPLDVYAYYYPWEMINSLLESAVLRVSRYARSRTEAEEALRLDGLRRAAEMEETEDREEEDLPMTSGQAELHATVQKAVEGKEWAEKEVKDLFIHVLRLFLSRMQSHLTSSPDHGTESDRVWITLQGWFRETCRRFWKIIGGMLVTLETVVFMGPEIDGRGEWDPRVKQELDLVVQLVKDRQVQVLG